MIRALLSVRFRSLVAMFLSRNAKKKSRTGTIILFSLLYIYLGIIMCGMSGFLFYFLSEPYHLMGLDWLYFAMAGMMSLAMAIIGNVFITQNQLYEARDNPLLLSMPIPAQYILLTRMVPLLVMNLLFVGTVMVPAIVVYAVWIELQVATVLIPALSILAIALLAQAIACLLGWFLHLLMSRISKSLASVIFLVVFLSAYFSVYVNANKILTSLITKSQAIADTLSAWVWPIYAMGKGSLGSVWHTIGFLSICTAVFLILYWVLSATFIRTATLSFASKGGRRLDLSKVKISNISAAIIRKDLKKFIASPVYLTNSGLGIVLCPVIAVCGILYKDKINSLLQLIMISYDQRGLIICAMLAFFISTMTISAPSVSLEGRNLWILKALPLSPRQILESKLSMHLLLTVPTVSLAGLVLAITYCRSVSVTLLCTVIPALLSLLNGLLGMVAGTKWAQFDFQNDVYPCKQSIFVAVSMFTTMSIPLALGLVYCYVLYEYINVTSFLTLCAGILLVLCVGLYELFRRWCPKYWDAF